MAPNRYHSPRTGDTDTQRAKVGKKAKPSASFTGNPTATSAEGTKKATNKSIGG